MNLRNNSINYCEHYRTENGSDFAKDVYEGLTALEKYIPCKYIYDEDGSFLFKKIMDLPEYYPTDCEVEILSKSGSEIADYFSQLPVSLVELGAGDGIKTEILLRAMLGNLNDIHYIPIDISESAVKQLIDRLSLSYTDLFAAGLISEYFHGLKHLSKIDKRKKLILFLGSNIGNMTHEEADGFLASLRRSLNFGDYLLIGFDLKKDINIINRAYNDSLGITGQFNKNILLRINRELGGDFRTDDFLYHSAYEPGYGAVRSYLVSLKKQAVRIESLNVNVDFDRYEAVHTESSYKYTREQISLMAKKSGFKTVKTFSDSREFFVDELWMAD